MLGIDTLVALLQRTAKAGLNRVPKKQKEAKALLALSLVPLDPDGIYDEQEIDEHLTDWLAQLRGPGTGVDHATWRRALVDHWFLRRATDGAIYRIQGEIIDEALSPEAKRVDPIAVFAEAETTKTQRQAEFKPSQP